jgi:hypothetical protein
MDLTADDIVTRITNAPDYGTASLVLQTCSLRRLREVADLIYATDYPDNHGKAFLRGAILNAARDIEPEPETMLCNHELGGSVSFPANSLDAHKAMYDSPEYPCLPVPVTELEAEGDEIEIY